MFVRAAKLGSIKALYNLYRFKKEIGQEEVAVKFLIKAAENGHPTAMVHYAMYCTHRLTTKTIVTLVISGY
jgi:TPR repeat protein